jgi:hypothetical protein
MFVHPNTRVVARVRYWLRRVLLSAGIVGIVIFDNSNNSNNVDFKKDLPALAVCSGAMLKAI